MKSFVRKVPRRTVKSRINWYRGPPKGSFVLVIVKASCLNPLKSANFERMKGLSRAGTQLVLPSLLMVLTTLALVRPLTSRADIILGNLPSSTGNTGGFAIGTEAANTFGWAVEFTPLQNISFDSVTLWVNGFTGKGADSGQVGANLSLNLMEDASTIGYPLPGPTAIIATAYAPPNDGSDAAFAFNLSGSLGANTPYWLFLYLGLTGPNASDAYSCYWDSGGAPVGDVIVDGSDSFAVGSFEPQSGSPAFALNSSSTGSVPAVPESYTAIGTALLLATSGARAFRGLRGRRVR